GAALLQENHARLGQALYTDEPAARDPNGLEGKADARNRPSRYRRRAPRRRQLLALLPLRHVRNRLERSGGPATARCPRAGIVPEGDPKCSHRVGAEEIVASC